MTAFRRTVRIRDREGPGAQPRNSESSVVSESRHTGNQNGFAGLQNRPCERVVGVSRTRSALERIGDRQLRLHLRDRRAGPDAHAVLRERERNLLRVGE